MKKLFVFIFISLTFMSFQNDNPQVDVRLIENHGDKIYSIYKDQHDYYKFLLWELDNGYKIVPKSKFENMIFLSIEDVVSKNGEAFNIDILNKKKEFNFYNYNFKRDKKNATYYDLKDGNVLMFTSLTKVWEDYRLSNKMK